MSEMIFQRSPHDKQNPYSQISRALIQDELISPECRLLIIYLLSMKDGFKININHLRSHFNNFMGRDKIYDVVNEAIRAGYIDRFVKVNGNLRSFCVYYVSETPEPSKYAELKKCFRRPGFQDPEKPEALIKSISSPKEVEERNNNNIRSENPEAHEACAIDSKSIKRKFQEVAEEVRLTARQIETLKTKHGPEKYDKIIDTLSKYKKRSGMMYSSDYMAILNWVEMAVHNKEMKEINREKTLKENLKGLEEIYNFLVANNKRGDLQWCKDTGIVSDSVFNKQADLNSSGLLKYVASWYGIIWR